ncbi:MAG: hypothetical protein K0U68_10535 [Gammaproteobacteria bacterium]|nr:hypothetical protein [Gammaproteobacteria bacterium]
MRKMISVVFGLLIYAGAAIAEPQPTLWITDDVTKNLYHVDLQGNLLQPPFRPPVGATSGLAIDQVNNTFWAVSEFNTGGVINFSRTGVELSTIPREDFSVSTLEGVATDFFNTDTLWVIDDPALNSDIARVYNIRLNGTLLSSFDRPATANSPQAIAVDPVDGSLWITDNRQDRIYNVQRDGVEISSFATSVYDPQATNPQGITVDEQNGTLWVTDRTTSTIYNLSRTGQLLSSFNRSAYDPNAPTASPVGIAFELSDNSGGDTSTVRDEFNSVSYSNNDGSVNWVGSWFENDPFGQGPVAGQVEIENGQLTLEDQPNSGGQPSIRRRVNLEGATSAKFTFDFATTTGVDSNDAVTVDVSSNGGSSWTTIEVFTGISGSTSGSRNYDISGFASATTEIRFRVTNLYGGSNELFLVDNVQIEFSSNSVTSALDEFNTVSYANNDGNLNWNGNWIEDDAFGGGAGGGQVQVFNNELTMEDSPNTGTQPGARREIDLSAASSAILSFDFGTTSGVDSTDAVVVDVSSNGGNSWTVLETFTGIFGSNSGSRCFDISAFATDRTQIRFRVTNLYGGSNELFLVDNVEVSIDSSCNN